MLLILTNSKDATADFLERALCNEGLPLIRLDTDTILSDLRISYSLGKVTLAKSGVSCTPTEISHVWYRRPQPLSHSVLGSSPEAKYTLSEWAECLEGFLAHIPYALWMNYPSRNAIASHKLEQISQAGQCGLRLPKTLLTQDQQELRAFYEICNGRVIVKPLAGGYVERPCLGSP